MTTEQLCALALAAIDDADARIVLADAIEESGWWHPVLTEPRDPTTGLRMGMRMVGQIPWQDREEFIGAIQMSALGLGTRCRAIAAVLLFGSWPTSWPLAEMCRPMRERAERLIRGTSPMFDAPSYRR